MEIDFLKKAIQILINGVQEEAIKKEKDEIARGVDLRDESKARLISPPNFSSTGEIILNLGETSYLTSRRMWAAYRPSLQIVRYFGADEAILYEIFHYLPGVAALVEKEGRFLIGVRSSSLGGTHKGMVSIPAGLMEQKEEIKESALRELNEETGLRGSVEKIADGKNPDAPNITFVCLIKNPEGEILSTYEAEGKQFIWVDKNLIISWLSKNEYTDEPNSDTMRIVETFKTYGIMVPDNLRMAPDIREGIKRLLDL